MGGMSVLPLLSLLLGCSAPNVMLGRLDTGVDSEPPPGPHDSAQDSAPGDTDTEHVPGSSAYEQSEHLFQLDRVHTLDIVLSAESYGSLQHHPFTYVVGEVVFDDEPVVDVGVRVKGRIGSYRDLSQKSAFKLDFNHFVEGRAFHGLEKLNLNSMVQDSAQVHELLSYEVWRLAGVPAPRVGYAWVRVNDADFGLYTLVEAYDDVFLAGRYEDPGGNLYDGDYVWYGGSSYQKLDFYDSLDTQMLLDEGEDVGFADLIAVTTALETYTSQPDFMEELGALVDLDEFVRQWAGEVWTGHYDSYSYNQNNYRVYFDPVDGLAEVFPWDPDWAFYSSTPITSPSGRITGACKADASCHAAFHQALAELMDAVDAAGLEAMLDEAVELITPHVEADPRKETTASSAAANQEAARQWIRNRRAILEATSGL